MLVRFKPIWLLIGGLAIPLFARHEGQHWLAICALFVLIAAGVYFRDYIKRGYGLGLTRIRIGIRHEELQCDCGKLLPFPRFVTECTFNTLWKNRKVVYEYIDGGNSFPVASNREKEWRDGKIVKCLEFPTKWWEWTEVKFDCKGATSDIEELSIPSLWVMDIKDQMCICFASHFSHGNLETNLHQYEVERLHTGTKSYLPCLQWGHACRSSFYLQEMFHRQWFVHVLCQYYGVEIPHLLCGIWREKLNHLPAFPGNLPLQRCELLFCE
jgi:hypothetical protein